jgi:hypothetical protein
VRSLSKIVRRGLALVALAAAVAGCDSATTLVVTVTVGDTSVPHFTELAINIASVADPTHRITQMFISTAPGYGTEGGLPAIALPQMDSFTIDPAYISGPVLVEVQGLEIYSGTVLATGSAPADVVAKQTTPVTVTLHGLGACPGDGGAADASPCDAGADAPSGG